MKLPEGYEEMTDEELKRALLRDYSSDAADYLIDIIRGRIEEDHPIY